ncbi:ERF superfamily protein [compost metagenome]
MTETVEFVEKEKPKKTTTYFTELKLTMTWVNADDPSEIVECPWYSQGVDIAGEKGVGKALTYGEKYFILKFFNIPTDNDDPDAFQKKFEQKASKEIQAKIREAWVKLGQRINLLEQQSKNIYGVGVAQLSEDSAEEFLTFIESKLGDPDGA